MKIAVRNTSGGPVVLTNANPAMTSEATLPATRARSVKLNASSAQVSTDQNHPYPAEIDSSALGPVVLPAGAAMSNPKSSSFSSSVVYGDVWSFERISATFKVPELLHPTKLRIDPGIISNGMNFPVVLDLTSMPDQQAGLFNGDMERAPLAPFQSGSLTVNISTVSGSIVSYHPVQRRKGSGNMSSDDLVRYRANNGGMFVAAIDATIKNTDITGDQRVNMTSTILDGYGILYQATTKPEIPSGTCASLPDSIGPGQSRTVRLCFAMPEAYAYGKVPLGLLLTTPQDVKVFALDTDPANLTNCSSQGLPTTIRYNGTKHPIEHEHTISATGSVDGTVHAKRVDLTEYPRQFDRIGIQSPGGQTISIRVTPNVPEGTSSGSWTLILQDPSGTTVFAARYGDESAPPLFQNVVLACGGTYAFYIRPSGFGLQEGEAVRYQVTVESPSVSGATPQASPMPSPSPTA